MLRSALAARHTAEGMLREEPSSRPSSLPALELHDCGVPVGRLRKEIHSLKRKGGHEEPQGLEPPEILAGGTDPADLGTSPTLTRA